MPCCESPFGRITGELYDLFFDIDVKDLLFLVQKALRLLADGVVFAMLKNTVWFP